MEKWKPINFKGRWNYDPRGELQSRINHAMEANDNYVAVPIPLAIACAQVRECDAITTMTADEDGPLEEPIEIFCRKIQEHEGMHYNGYISWED